jgi:hypothetical protein
LMQQAPAVPVAAVPVVAAAPAAPAAPVAAAATAAPAAPAAPAATATPPPAEYAPEELFLEEECPEGTKCPNGKHPDKCPKNHHRLGDKIKQGAKLPHFFCKWERPWKQMRCRSYKCFYSHLDGRREFLENPRQNTKEHAA